MGMTDEKIGEFVKKFANPDDGFNQLEGMGHQMQASANLANRLGVQLKNAGDQDDQQVLAEVELTDEEAADAIAAIETEEVPEQSTIAKSLRALANQFGVSKSQETPAEIVEEVTAEETTVEELQELPLDQFVEVAAKAATNAATNAMNEQTAVMAAQMQDLVALMGGLVGRIEAVEATASKESESNQDSLNSVASALKSIASRYEKLEGDMPPMSSINSLRAAEKGVSKRQEIVEDSFGPVDPNVQAVFGFQGSFN